MQKKSQLVSFLLTFFFGPLGLLYSSVLTALIVFAISIIVITMTVATGDIGFGLFVTIAGAIITGIFSVSSYNENLEAEEKKQKELQEEMVKKAIEDSKQKDFIQEQMIRRIIRENQAVSAIDNISEPLSGQMKAEEK